MFKRQITWVKQEDWQTLAGALQGKTNVFRSVNISLQALANVRDSIKNIWDATREGFSVRTENEEYIHWLPVYKYIYDWEKAWTKLKRISDMTEDEFVVECQADYQLGYYQRK